MTTPVEALWLTYQINHSKEIRDRLIEVHAPLVEYVARRMYPRMHSSVELQDLVAYGMFGLIDAIERYNVHTGVKFSTFATYRIQGAITDELRSQAWEPRSVRARYREVVEATNTLEHELGRLPNEGEVATRVGITVLELRRIESDTRASKVRRLDERVNRSGTFAGESDQRAFGDTLTTPDNTELTPQLGEASVMMASGLVRLTEHEQLLLRLIYVTGIPLKGIAEALGVTESWVSHLHTKVMIRLQRTLAAQY